MFEFNANYVLSNDKMYGYDKDFDTNKFLHNIKSPLIGAGNIKTSKLIDDACNIDIEVKLGDKVFKGINQRWMIVTIQKESSGITQPLSAHRLSRILGYGIPDKSPAHKETLGFENQLRYGAKRLFDYAHPMFQKQHGVGIKQAFKVDFNHRTVYPVNQATLSNYLYTPHIGNQSFEGNGVPYGNYLFHIIWGKFFNESPAS